MTAAVLRIRHLRKHMFPEMKQHAEVKDQSLTHIAPRYQTSPSRDGNSDCLSKTTTGITTVRPRLPPRSRYGCWTCRTRKVKCDEAKPECTPCSRLGHSCDYNPRLSFKDDTFRVIKKTTGRGGGLGPVWKSATGNPSKRQRIDTTQEDLLPPFTFLTNDDDRERKAESKPAGTYNLVVNPSSFINFEDYRETFPEDVFPLAPHGYGGPPTRMARQDRFSLLEMDPEEKLRTVARDDDPDIVILKVFEDDNQKLVSLGPNHLASKGRHNRTKTLSPTSSGTSGPRNDVFSFSIDNTPLMKYAHPDGRDHRIIHYYTSFVHRHLAQVHRDTLGTSMETGALCAQDVLEREAGKFVPLYHALMAFSALSMSHKHGIPSLDALQHYQQALPSLKASLHTEEDLASDGVYLTHFILLLYEIAAGTPRGIGFWSQHISQLQKIILLRRDRHGSEPYSFIVWWVACIDMHVMLSDMGKGEFLETMLRRRLLPPGIGSDAYYTPTHSLPSPTPYAALPSSLSFHRRICVLVAELALLARDLRDKTKRMKPHEPSPATRQIWQASIGVLQDTLRRTWKVQIPASKASEYCNQLLPVGARGVFEHTFALYRGILIYSHTSMYPAQHLHYPSHTIPEVGQCAGQVLRLAREIVASGHVERKFIVFPLIISAFVNKNQVEREEILGLVKRMEEDSVGRNVVAARQLLEIVYERQERKREEQLRKQGKCEGESGLESEEEVMIEDVDWVGMLGELGLQVVNGRL